MDEINVALDQLQLSSFPSAKIKVDELFLRWLVSNEGSQTVSNLFQEIEGKSNSPKKRTQSEMYTSPTGQKGGDGDGGAATGGTLTTQGEQRHE